MAETELLFCGPAGCGAWAAGHFEHMKNKKKRCRLARASNSLINTFAVHCRDSMSFIIFIFNISNIASWSLHLSIGMFMSYIVGNR